MIHIAIVDDDDTDAANTTSLIGRYYDPIAVPTTSPGSQTATPSSTHIEPASTSYSLTSKCPASMGSKPPTVCARSTIM